MEVREGYKKKEVGFIPTGWDVKEFGKLAEKIIGGGTPSRSNPLFWGNEIPWVTVKDFATFNCFQTQEYITKEGLKNSSAHLIPKDTIIISTRMALGKAVIYKIDVSINQDLKAIFTNRIIDTNYFFYWFQFYSKYIADLGSGSTVMGLSLSDLRKIKITLPSLPEQTAIVATLSDADALIINLEKLIEKKRAIKQGAMQELLKPKEGWVVKKLGEIADVTKLAGFEYTNYFNSYNDGGEIVVVRGTNITHNKMDLTDVKYIPRTTSNKLQRSKLRKDDLVFAYVGTIGPAFLVDENDKYHLGPNTSKISSSIELSPIFLFHYFTSALIKKEIIDNTSIGAQPSLSMIKIRKFNILLPPKDIQIHIATILSNMDAEIASLEQKLLKCKLLKQGMMQELLTGKTRLV